MSGDERARVRVIAEVLDTHTPDGYFRTPDGHRECYCGHVLAEDETWMIHVAAAVAAALPTPAPQAGRCICDGAAYHTAEGNASRHPFLVHPECPVHTPAPAGEDATLTADKREALAGRLTVFSVEECERRCAAAVAREHHRMVALAQRGAADQATLAAIREARRRLAEDSDIWPRSAEGAFVRDTCLAVLDSALQGHLVAPAGGPDAGGGRRE